MAQILGLVEDLVERAGRLDGVEAGRAVDFDAGGVDPDPGLTRLAPDRHGFGRAFDGDDDVKPGRRDRLFPFHRAVDQDVGPVEIGGDRDAVIAEARHDLFLRGGGRGDKKGGKKGEAAHQNLPTGLRE